MDKSLFIPSSDEDISSEWITLALNRDIPHLSFSECTKQRIGEDYGFASKIYRCRLRDSNSIDSVVVKTWYADKPEAAREVEFYNSIAPRLDIRIPKCYHADTDAKSGYSVLIMEDLKGSIQGNCLEQLPLDRALAVAGMLSNLHASWWKSSELTEMTWLPHITIEDRGEDWFQPRRKLLLERFSNLIQPEIQPLIEKAEMVNSRLQERLQGVPITLVHSDIHLDNFLFDDERGMPILLDWARVSKGPVIIDLSELLFSLSRVTDYDRVLARYIDGLVSGGVSKSDLASFNYQLEGALLHQFIKSTFAIARWYPSSSRGEEIIITTLKRIQDVILHRRAHSPGLFKF